MPHNRFFSNHLFQVNHTIVLSADETHHMRVMRCKEQNTVELVNGKNQLATATVKKIGKTNAELFISDVHTKNPPSKRILVQAIIRFSKLEWILEKATELGITHFLIFPSENSDKTTLTSQQKKRANTILISAMKQCGRLDLPDLQEFSSKTALPDIYAQRYLGSLEKKAPKLIYEKPNQENVLLIIGPEKGFTPNEITFFSKQYNAKEIKLSDYILRSETAAICGSSILSLLR